MPSNHLILCHPLLFLSSIFPSMRVFSNESVLCIRWPEYLSFSFSISPSNEYWGLISLKFVTFFKKHYFWFKWRTHSVCIQIHTDTQTHSHMCILYGHTQQSKILYCFYLFILLTTPHGMWDLSFPVGDGTYAPCTESRVLTMGPWGKVPSIVSELCIPPPSLHFLILLFPFEGTKLPASWEL